MWLDWLSLGFFMFCWVGYSLYSDHESEHRACFMNVSKRLREIWMISAFKRPSNTRQVDVITSSSVSRNASFFASTTVLTIAASLAGFQAIDRIVVLVSEMTFSYIPDENWFYTRALLLLVIFTFAFFQFSWTLIQFNQGSIAIAAINPEIFKVSDKKIRNDAKNIADIFALASKSFNAGIRSYYFAIAALGWFYHPIAFMAMSALIVLVLYRRDFHSKTLKAMLKCLDLNE